jgi:hypothetical protein
LRFTEAIKKDIMAGGKSLPDNDMKDKVVGPRGNAGDSRRELYRYASLSGQVAASVGISIFFGIKADKWLNGPFPIFSWALPLLVIVLLIVKLVNESSGKNDGK